MELVSYDKIINFVLSEDLIKYNETENYQRSGIVLLILTENNKSIILNIFKSFINYKITILRFVF